MTTQEYFQKELEKHKENYERLVARNAPEQDIVNVKTKISHYELVCELIKVVCELFGKGGD